jgi:arylsulfatase A-like enzyme
MKRPNILFVVFDQMRADCLFGALGQTVALPNLRAFMADSVAFTNHVSVTSPCGPARASLLTGQYAMNHRSVRNGTPLPMDKPNLASELRRGGIMPLLYGYTDTAADPRHYDAADPILTSYEQVMNGFTEALELRFDDSRTWRGHLEALGYDVPAGNDLYVPTGDRPDAPALYHADHSDTAFLTDRFLEDLPTRGDGWCAHVTFIRPHPPFVAPAPYNSLVDAASMPAPAGGIGEAFAGAHPFNAQAITYRQAHDMVCGFPGLAPSLETTAMLRAVYLGLVAELDHHFGRIIAHLKSRGQYEDTLIVVTSDHGELLGDHGCWGKMSYLDAAFRVPLMIRAPGARPARVDLPTESVDVMPTILDWLGLDCPDTVDGRSLMPLAGGETPAGWRDYSVSELDFGDPVTPTAAQQQLGLPSDECGVAILRTATHSLVHFNGGLPPILFDHDGEGEGRNIAGDSGADTIRLSMMERLLNHRMRHAEGQFARTMITPDGVVRGQH